MLQKLLKNVKRPVVNFANLKKSRKRNVYLVAPPGLCSIPALESPIFEKNAEDLAHAFEQMVLSMPKTEKLSETRIEEALQVDYVQYSKNIGFPDTITVRFLDHSKGKSTLAIYSRSHYGYRDFGVNKKRVHAWMKTLSDAV